MELTDGLVSGEAEPGVRPAGICWNMAGFTGWALQSKPHSGENLNIFKLIMNECWQIPLANTYQESFFKTLTNSSKSILPSPLMSASEKSFSNCSSDTSDPATSRLIPGALYQQAHTHPLKETAQLLLIHEPVSVLVEVVEGLLNRVDLLPGRCWFLLLLVDHSDWENIIESLAGMKLASRSHRKSVDHLRLRRTSR